jgi:hypothetical protein
LLHGGRDSNTKPTHHSCGATSFYLKVFRVIVAGVILCNK